MWTVCGAEMSLKDVMWKIWRIQHLDYLLQPVESLQNTDEYMKSFFASKTYLEKGDPKIFERIAQYLNRVKLPKTNDCKEERQSNDVDNRQASNTEILEMFLTSM